MCSWMDRRMNEWVDVCMDGQMAEGWRMNRWMVDRGQTEEYRMDMWMVEYLVECVDDG